MNKLNFESENLVVDWIGFNIEGLRYPEGMAVYLSEKFGFNSIVKKANLNQLKKSKTNESQTSNSSQLKSSNLVEIELKKEKINSRSLKLLNYVKRMVKKVKLKLKRLWDLKNSKS